MQRSDKQKLLLILSLAKILLALILLVAGVVTAISSLVGAGAPGVAETGILASFGRVLPIFACIVEIFVGLFGMRASNNVREAVSVWYLAIIDIALLGISCILTIVLGAPILHTVFFVLSLIVSACMLWISNELKDGSRL